MNFPTTSKALIPMLQEAGYPPEITDVQLKVAHGGRLFFAITFVASADDGLLMDQDGEPWTTTQYVPFDRLVSDT